MLWNYYGKKFTTCMSGWKEQNLLWHVPLFVSSCFSLSKSLLVNRGFFPLEQCYSNLYSFPNVTDEIMPSRCMHCKQTLDSLIWQKNLLWFSWHWMSSLCCFLEPMFGYGKQTVKSLTVYVWFYSPLLFSLQASFTGKCCIRTHHFLAQGRERSRIKSLRFHQHKYHNGRLVTALCGVRWNSTQTPSSGSPVSLSSFVEMVWSRALLSG